MLIILSSCSPPCFLYPSIVLFFIPSFPSPPSVIIHPFFFLSPSLCSIDTHQVQSTKKRGSFPSLLSVRFLFTLPIFTTTRASVAVSNILTSRSWLPVRSKQKDIMQRIQSFQRQRVVLIFPMGGSLFQRATFTLGEKNLFYLKSNIYNGSPRKHFAKQLTEC